MSKPVYFINLSNGINVPVRGLRSYIRIQSTACEQKRWEFILNDLDHNFLYHLASGFDCVIVDKSEKARLPRSIWQGMEWIKYALNRVWFHRRIENVVLEKHSGKEKRIGNYWDKQFKALKKGTLNKIKYYRKYLKSDGVNIRHINY